eukprot:gene26691-32252_t
MADFHKKLLDEGSIREFHFVDSGKPSEGDFSHHSSLDTRTNPLLPQGMHPSSSSSPQQTKARPWFASMFGKKGPNSKVDGFNKPRKVPVKIEPKVFFANERTFLSWLQMAVTLATISIAILAFADHNPLSQVYGLLLMPVSIAFCAYALYVFIQRAGMIRRKDPGPYEAKLGPIALAGLLAVSIFFNLAVKLYQYST